MILNIHHIFHAANSLSLNCRVVRIRRTREANQEAVLLSLCTRTFKSKVIIFRLDFTGNMMLSNPNSIKCLKSLAFCISPEKFLFPSCASGTKQAAHRLKILFGLAGLKAAELHGNLTQAQRLDVKNLDPTFFFCSGMSLFCYLQVLK